MSTLVRTTEVSPADRADYWRAAASKSFVNLNFTVPEPVKFRGEIITESIGGVTVSRVTAGAHTAERTERHIARAHDDGYYKLSMPVRGYLLISQDGREAPLLPGDLAIYDTSRPYQVSFDDTCQMLVLMFPHRDLRLSQRAMGDLTARRVSGRQGIGGLVAPLLGQSRLPDRGDRCLLGTAAGRQPRRPAHHPVRGAARRGRAANRRDAGPADEDQVVHRGEPGRRRPHARHHCRGMPRLDRLPAQALPRDGHVGRALHP